MNEVRVVRREDRSLIVATDQGEEFRLEVDDAVLAEIRQLAKRANTSPNKIKPREIQALVRAGKSRGEIAELTGLEESDIERYEEPVLAERRYILELAHAVAVRTSPGDAAEQLFGTVIAERLITLEAEGPVWSSWRDEEAGWMVSLDFLSHDVSHRAIWSFEHRKGALSPITPDAVSLSKQGDVGDRLIPKLRAVDDLRHAERFDSGAFDPEQLGTDGDSDAGHTDAAPAPKPTVVVAPDHPSTGAIPIIDVEAEFARRRGIEDRAIKTSEPEMPDLGQTADLLDALRRRRGERSATLEPVLPSGDQLNFSLEDAEPTPGSTSPLHLLTPEAEHSPMRGVERSDASDTEESARKPSTPTAPEKPGTTSKQKGRGRPGIPSWDDILFGTRSEDDPA